MPGLENRIVVGDYLVIRDLREVRMWPQQPLDERLWQLAGSRCDSGESPARGSRQSNHYQESDQRSFLTGEGV